VLFFALLVLYQLNLAFFRIGLVEGLENNSKPSFQEYNTNDPNNALILAQQNAGNIEFLKSQIDFVLEFRDRINKMDTRVNDLTTQVEELVLSQKSLASEKLPEEPPVITGAVEEEEEEVYI